GIPPDDGSAPFGRNHGVEGVLHDVHAVAHGHGQRSPRTAFSRDGDDDGHGQTRHLSQIVRDGFPLAALLGVYAGVRAGRVNESEHRPAKFCRELHHPQGLTVAFWFGLTKIAYDALFRVAALLVADDRNGAPAEFAHAGNHRFVIHEAAVAVNLDEIG